ncbi:MAG: FmdE family protein [Desulfococcaceae bacterium]
MNAKEIMNSEEFRRCEAFHGHVCPGLAMGFRAAKAGMEWLKEKRSEDEEIVAIVETDACSADAVQVLTGCTFGKGNFIFKDYGKMALTLLSRNSGRGVRVSIRPGAFRPDPEHSALIQKVLQGSANETEQARFQELHRKRTCDLLETPLENLFSLASVETQLPPMARMEPSELCGCCGEPVMPSKMEYADGKKVCRGCLNI